MWSARVLFCLGLLTAGGLTLGGADAQEGKKDEAALTVEQITKVYADDPEGFDKKYKGKVVTVEGVVDYTTGPDIISKQRFAILKGSYKKAGEVLPHLVRCIVPEIDDLRTGHSVRIRGTCQGH